ncbi:sigma-54-dependent transcriptional regulator [Coralliovum pocilloporae]|uniref:sigma-54-dependent transcriptional regulator n=1 Tax=Coralliovum pocilloporae TaxID=3066369 RepID=UPI0033075A0E
MEALKNYAVILIDDEEDVRQSTGQVLELQDIDVLSFARAERAVARLGRSFDGAVVSDIRMSGMDGLQLLAAVQNIDHEIPVILITGHGDIAQAVKAIQSGAYDYIEKPALVDRLPQAIKKACRLRHLVLEKRAMERTLEATDPLELVLIGRSAPMEQVRQQVDALSDSSLSVHLTGETGTGKELVARTIHENSDRKDYPFVAVNLVSLQSASIEVELFGCEAGAFPGAIRTRIGRLEHARNGTLFLDKIESVPLPVQAKLLRVLEEGCVQRVGSHERIPLDTRIISSSNADLDHLVDTGAFRKDLLYRLAVIKLAIPPLRDRREDIPRLFQHLVNTSALRMQRPAPTIAAETLSALMEQTWEGNVRELRNAADRLVMGFSPLEEPYEAASDETLADALLQQEKVVIARTLAEKNGDLKETYEALGLSRKTLYEKMQRHNLNRDDFRG